MRTQMKAIVALLFLATFIATSAAISCTPTQNQATALPNIIPNPTSTITFDDLGYSTPRDYEVKPQNITVGSQVIMFSGVSCTASDYVLSMDNGGLTVWNGNAGWQGGSESGQPGYYIAGVSDGSQPIYESTCVITFFPPVSEIWFRYNRASDVLAVANIYDSSNQIITCTELDTRQNGLSNYYFEAGWRATSRQIKTLEFNGGYFAVDNIQWRTGCGDGNAWNGAQCVDFDECLLGQCSTKASCANVDNGVQCTCNTGYTGDGLGPSGCTDIKECQLTPNGGCPDPSVCGETEGSFTCICPAGTTGNSGSPADVVCEDVDECSLPSGLGYPCVSSASCSNKTPGYTCTCPMGYTGDGEINGQGCSLKNLCDPDPCSPDASCASFNGMTFTCTCNDGFTGNGIGANGCTANPVAQPSGTTTPSAAPNGSTTPGGTTTPDGTTSPDGTPVDQGTPDGSTPAAGGNSPTSGPGSSSVPKSNLVSSTDQLRVEFAVGCFVALLFM